MAVRRVPEDYPDVASAVAASSPGDIIQIASHITEYATITVDDLTFVQDGFFNGGPISLAPGIREFSESGSTLFRVLGNNIDNVLNGGDGTGYYYGYGGNDALIGGPGADWMEGDSGNDTYEVDDAASAGGQGYYNRVPLFYGDVVLERPGQGFDTVWAYVDYTLPTNVEALVLAGGATRGNGNELDNLILGNDGANVLAGLGGNDEMRGGAGNDTYLVDSRGDRVVEQPFQGIDDVWSSVDYELPADVENLVLLGTAAWGSGTLSDNRIVGNDEDNRLVGWGGRDALTGGGGDDIFYFLDDAYFRTMIADFWAGAGSNDQLAFSQELFSSRDQALLASWQVGPDVHVVRDELHRVILQNTRLSDLTLDDFLIV